MQNKNPFTPTLAATALGGLIAGAVTGATVAAAANARKVKDGDITKKDAVSKIAREAGTMGVASSMGLTATALLGITGVFSVASVAFLTASSKYAIESLIDTAKCETKKSRAVTLAIEENSETV